MHGERVSANNEKPRILGHESRQDIVKIVGRPVNIQPRRLNSATSASRSSAVPVSRASPASSLRSGTTRAVMCRRSGFID